MKQKLIKDLAKQQKRILKERQQREELQAECDHKIEKKNHNVTALKEHGDHYKCSICGAVVDFTPIDKKALADAVQLIIRANEQIKVVYDDFNDEIRETIGANTLYLDRLEEIYKPVRKEIDDSESGVQERYYDNDGPFTAYGSFATSARGPLLAGDYSKKKNKTKNKNKNKNKEKNKKKKKSKYSFLNY